ncbi:hypothetical protein HKBW3C_00392, partial [Candidatus Hakubella thermalkaliphila]
DKPEVGEPEPGATEAPDKPEVGEPETGNGADTGEN